MSPIACPACGSREAGGHRWATANADRRRYRLLRCAQCGSEWLPDPAGVAQPAALHEGGVYAPSRGILSRLIEPLRSLSDRDRMRLIGRLPVQTRVIEVGSGRGRLLRRLRAAEQDAVGIEPSPSSVEAAAAMGVRLEHVPIESAAFPAGEADLVIFWHVLEHLTEQQAALTRARSWLSADGRVVIAVPNRSSLQARLGGDRWFHQDVPRHRLHLTPTGLQRLLERSGFRQTSIRHLMVQQNLLGMWLTLLNWLTSARDVPFRFMKRDLRYERRLDAVRDAVVAPLAGLALVPAAIILELIAGILRRGGTIVVEAEPA